MQARMRRNRVAILIATSIAFTSTCAVQVNGSTTQGSRVANTVFAATTSTAGMETDEHAVSGPLLPANGPFAQDATDADTYDVTNWWKAELSDYDKSLSLTRYEATEAEPDPLLTTTAVTTDSTQTTTTAITTYPEPAVTAVSTICAAPNSVVFYSSGYGHGVGLSQNGANYYAKYDGWTYDQILSHYYPGTNLVQTNVDASTRISIGNCSGDIVSVIAQVVNLEMGPSMSPEALKAQAIAIYSFYLYHGHGAGLVGKSNPSQNILDAVRSVLGVAVYYNGSPALTMFYASSGGTTASCRDIFYMNIPYLVSVPAAHDASSDPYYSEATVFSASALKARLESTYRVTLSGSPYDWIQLVYGDGGYVSHAIIGGQVTVKGNSLRAVLGLRSPKFEFVYQAGNTPAGTPAPAQPTTPVVAPPTSPIVTLPPVVTTTQTTTTTTTTTLTSLATEVEVADAPVVVASEEIQP